jgi:hypothetical protein
MHRPKAVHQMTPSYATVDHAKRQFAVGAVHTNMVEGFWSIFNRGIVGAFHNVNKKYLHLYVAEFQFRYNNRFNDDIFGAAIEGAEIIKARAFVELTERSSRPCRSQ